MTGQSYKIVCANCKTGMDLLFGASATQGSIMQCPTCGTTCIASETNTFDWRLKTGAIISPKYLSGSFIVPF